MKNGDNQRFIVELATCNAFDLLKCQTSELTELKTNSSTISRSDKTPSQFKLT